MCYRPAVPYDQIIGFSIAAAVMLIGIAGSFLPAIPSTPLVFLSALLHWLWFRSDDAGAHGWVLIVMFVAMVLSLVLEQIASMIGAKKMGATGYGTTGAVVGAIVGLFFGFFGVLIGPFLGAVAFEVLGGRELRESLKAGLGAFIGLLAGSLGKIAFCFAMSGLWAVDVIYKASGK